MRRLFDHLNYYWDRFTKSSMTFLCKALTSLSFLLIIFYFGYVVYYSTMCYSTPKVIAGCASLYIMIHLNKSL